MIILLKFRTLKWSVSLFFSYLFGYILLLVLSVRHLYLGVRAKEREREKKKEKKITSRRQVRVDNISQNNLGTRVTTAVESAKRRITLLGIKEVSRKKVQNVQQVRSCQTCDFYFFIYLFF